MNRSLLLACLLALPHSAGAGSLTIERLFSDPKLEGAAPRALAFSPDGTRVTYLQGREQDYQRYDLWEYHLADAKNRLLVNADTLHSGAEQLSDEEKARRERQRIYGSGIMEYSWSEDGNALLFPLAGDVFYYDVEKAAAQRLTDSEGFETDVRVSPGGRYVSFIRDQNIFLVDLDAGAEKQLTHDGGGTIKNGMAEFVAQEEMGRLTGYWWSPDERHIAYLQVDESPVDEVTRSEIYADRIDVIKQRYPAAGRPNVTLRLGILELATGKTRWLDLGDDSDIYIPRVKWAGPQRLSYQWQDRPQQRLELRLFDLDSGETRTLLTETAATWINLHEDLHFIDEGRAFIWASERDGFKHLYLYRIDGSLQRQLTHGEWVVDEVEAVNEEAGEVYFTGRMDTPRERHLYRVPLDGESAPQRISRRAGMHDIEFADSADAYIDHFSSAAQPAQVSLHRADGSHIVWLEQNELAGDHPLVPYLEDWIAPEFGTFRAPQGHTLHYRLYKPAKFDPEQRYPAIVHVYGGPGAQLVTNSWDRPFNQYLAQQGYVVFTVDNRGSHHRGKAFEDPIYRNMGQPEVEDQVSGAKFLAGKSWIDPQRIGIYGHSYGGYMTLMALFKASDVFAAGVSGAPVTDWLLYDTHYTERYMGHPEQAGKAYERASVLPYAAGLSGPLLLGHGMADDNVLFSHSTRLMKHLQDNSQAFELMTYPGKKHSLRGKQTRIHWYGMIAAFFDRHLKTVVQ